MDIQSFFPPEKQESAFSSYEEYTRCLFACVDNCLSAYIKDLMSLFAVEGGGFKNILYPDIEVAHDLCEKHLSDFAASQNSFDQAEFEPSDDVDPELSELFHSFFEESSAPESTQETNIEDLLAYVSHRAEMTNLTQVPMPLWNLFQKLEFAPFTIFAFTCAILSSTQTNYSSVFQVINQNGALSAPSIESAARAYYGKKFSITGAYGHMSLALEQLKPILPMQINDAMPFSTVLSPDKRLIDFLFSPHPLRVDENYSRFFSRMEDTKDPFIANQGILDAINIAYDDGGRLFSLFGRLNI